MAEREKKNETETETKCPRDQYKFLKFFSVSEPALSEAEG